MNKRTSFKKKRIFITGASGKIGRKLVTRLLNEGYEVIALVRDKNKLPLKHPNLKIIEADILQQKKYFREIRKCDYVYHLAVYQNISDQNKNNFIRVNVDGTRLILEAVIKSRVKRVIYISTIMVFKPTRKKQVDEKSPKKTSANGNYYVETKLLALKTIEKFRAKVPVVTLYPTIVIDLKDIVSEGNKPIPGWQGFLWKIIGGGVPGGLMGMIGDKNRMMNYILMDNLVAAMISVINREKAGNDYILGGENITVENYLRETLRIRGRIFFPFRIPVFLLKMIALIKIPQFKVIDFIAKNPPEDICVNPQKAVKNLGLRIARLKAYQ